jgi:predicted nucleic acid-binding protein
MRLVVDASTLVAEALRERGQARIADPELDLFVASDAWSETEHELRRRAAIVAERGYLEPTRAAQLLEDVWAVLTAAITVVPRDAYADWLAEARRRVPRDPNDAPTVALALALDCGIWTNDRDFFGCGLPVWVSETLQAHLASQRQE